VTLLLFGMCKQSGIKSHNNLAYNPKQTGPKVGDIQLLLRLHGVTCYGHDTNPFVKGVKNFDSAAEDGQNIFK
jgi:hypothetical protein